MAHFVAPFVGHDVPVAPFPFKHLHSFAEHESPDKWCPETHATHFIAPLEGHEVPDAPDPDEQAHRLRLQVSPLN